MILRVELPKPLPKGVVYAQGIKVFLDGKELERIRCIDASVSKFPFRKIDNYTLEFNGEFGIREVNEENEITGLFDVYGK